MVVVDGERHVGLDAVADVELDVAATVLGVDDPDDLFAVRVLKSAIELCTTLFTDIELNF